MRWQVEVDATLTVLALLLTRMERTQDQQCASAEHSSYSNLGLKTMSYHSLTEFAK